MFKQKVLIIVSLLLIKSIPDSKSWPNLSPDFDPDIDVCNDPAFDEGVVAYDGSTYLFKNQYYWTAGALGIVGFAKLTANRWPEITDRIRASFTITYKNDLTTVFVVGTKWFAYRNAQNVIQGTIDMWPGFDKMDVTAVVSPTLGSNSVYFLHSDNSKYQMYDFTDILKPVNVRSGKADVQMGTTILTFIDNYMKSWPSVPIKTVIDVTVGLSYAKSLILLSKESYCAYNLGEASATRGCSLRPISKLLGCPLHLKSRSSTLPMNDNSMTGQGLESTLSYFNDSLIERLNGSQPNESQPNESSVTFTTKWDDSQANGPIITGIPILGKEYKFGDEGDNSQNTTTQRSAALEGPQKWHQLNRLNSNIWIILFIVGFILVIIFALLMVGGVAKVSNSKKSKGDVIYIKK